MSRLPRIQRHRLLQEASHKIPNSMRQWFSRKPSYWNNFLYPVVQRSNIGSLHSFEHSIADWIRWQTGSTGRSIHPNLFTWMPEHRTREWAMKQCCAVPNTAQGKHGWFNKCLTVLKPLQSMWSRNFPSGRDLYYPFPTWVSTPDIRDLLWAYWPIITLMKGLNDSVEQR